MSWFSNFAEQNMYRRIPVTHLPDIVLQQPVSPWFILRDQQLWICIASQIYFQGNFKHTFVALYRNFMFLVQ